MAQGITLSSPVCAKRLYLQLNCELKRKLTRAYSAASTPLPLPEENVSFLESGTDTGLICSHSLQDSLMTVISIGSNCVTTFFLGLTLTKFESPLRK